MAVFNNVLAGASGQTAGGAYEIERSLRFNSSDSAYLSKNFASAGNRKTWTWAGWVKRSGLASSTQYSLFGNNGNSDTTFGLIAFFNDNIIIGGFTINYLVTSAVYRDPGAWMHIVVAMDTTQATASNRLKVYVNGSEVTVFSTDNRSSITQNSDQGINQAVSHAIGRQDTGSGSSYFSGYLADIHFIDGQALDPTSFTETDATTGQLVPIEYTGSYGTNGFHLPFSDNSTAAALGTDTSGAGNDWDVYNIQAVTGGPTSVASASGALPIYNTTDTYGTTKGTGTRTDSNSSSIVLAIPMNGANGGTTFTDESATIKGSGSAKTITTHGNTETTTSESYFYGSSGFFDGSGDYLSLTTTSDFAFGTGDFTIEFWAYVPTAEASNLLPVFDNDYNSTGGIAVAIRQSDSFFGVAPTAGGSGFNYNGFSAPFSLNTWNHFAIGANNGVYRAFINGRECSLASGSTTVLNISRSSGTTEIGRLVGQTGFDFGGYLQDLRIYKGVAKYTSNFNPPSSTQNATIAAGNDSLVDTPTNGSQTDTGAGGEVVGNYATWNPLFDTYATSSNTTWADGNLEASATNRNWTVSTIAFNGGKWYAEMSLSAFSTGSPTGGILFGVSEVTAAATSIAGPARSSDSNGYSSLGNIYNNNSLTSVFATFGVGDIIGVAVDISANTVAYYKNGSLVSSRSHTFVSGKNYVFCTTNEANIATSTIVANFGQRPFAYPAPSGYKALCTANLDDPVVAQPSTVMDVALYTGNGSTQTISGLGFSPDLVWLKRRDTSGNNKLTDIVRGATKELVSDATAAEITNANGLTAFTSDGFTLGIGGEYNGLNGSFVAWTWDAGSSTVSNTDGSITSTVRANPSAGFSIVSYTGTGSNATVGHGLGAAPSLIITKSRNNAWNWTVYHSSLGINQYLFLDSTAAATVSSGYWNTAPTSTIFGVGNNNTGASGNNVVAYCFAPVDGYSSFGSYTGNGSTDGPFVYTGFRVKWYLVKQSSASGENWRIIDATRSPYNVAQDRLLPNSSAAEAVQPNEVDFLSNGFKFRSSDGAYNASGATYIYAAFAENPFKYARAR